MSEEFGGLIPLLFVLVFLPGLCIAVTRQAADGLIGRNGSAGIRTRHTKASDEAWVAGHRAALPVVKKMWPAAAAGVLAAVVVQFVAGGGWGTGAAFLALIVETVILVRSASAANGAARAAGGAAGA
ncbi:SdpI family protein [Arthrobacter citreus]|uniref:SdpI family protein n=1 Tax=Arthrobacter citreus TaxID=1670 RepID=A0ABZ2ZUS9_9MICC